MESGPPPLPIDFREGTFEDSDRVSVCSRRGSVCGPFARTRQCPPCDDSRARQFDFWVGEWTVSQNARTAGHNKISNIHGGCTILEEYQAESSSYEGKSFNYYDPADDSWHQIWVDNGGIRLHLTGGYGDGKMVMSGERTTAEGTVIDRITWHNDADGTVLQVWEMSEDAGVTWETFFSGLYERN